MKFVLFLAVICSIFVMNFDCWWGWFGGQCHLCQEFWPSKGRGSSSDITFTLGGNALICASMASMLVKGIQHNHGATVTLVAYEPQLIMYRP